MKYLFVVLFIFSFSATTFAQEEGEEKSHKFRQDNIFIGSGIGLGLGGGGFSVGANPEVGYSIAEWMDAGISTNFNYYSFNAESNNGIRQRSFNYGGGIFLRFFPFRGFFLQVLPEYNITKTTLKDMRPYSTGEEFKYTEEAPSLLLGVGYATREIGSTSFYTAIMFDAGNNTSSPYIGALGSKLPILRTGFNFYLRPKRK